MRTIEKIDINYTWNIGLEHTLGNKKSPRESPEKSAKR